MTGGQIKDGLANMARLDAIVTLAEAASPKLKRRGDRFRRALDERQKGREPSGGSATKACADMAAYSGK